MTTKLDNGVPPRVSLGLPVYNGEKYVATAIESILAQDFEDFELVITDNASTDGTEEICRTFAASDERIRYHRNERNLGACANFNRCLELSSGEFFKWCACDDYLSPNFVGACVRTLDTNTKAVLAYATTQSVDQDGNPIPLVGKTMGEKTDLHPARRYRDILCNKGTCFEIFGLFRSEALKRSSLHRPYYGSDFALIAEIALLGQLVHAREAIFYNREHADRSINIADKMARVAWHRGDANRKSSREHTMLLAHLFEIAFRHRKEAPLGSMLLYTAVFAMTPVQLSRYALETIGIVLPGASDRLRRIGWSAVHMFRGHAGSVHRQGHK
jgi:glycosyltransferase involved in cell wall biosynthesis